MIFLTKEQAISCLKVDKYGEVHNFISAPFGLVGAGYELARAIKAINATDKPEHLQIAGEQAKGVGHALAVYDSRINDYSFFETDMNTIREYEILGGNE
jgi:hypothetical protein